VRRRADSLGALLSAAAALLLLSFSGWSEARTTHDRAYWVALRSSGFAPPLFLRSFSLLALSVLAAEDLRRPFLDAQQFDALLELAVAELGASATCAATCPVKAGATPPPIAPIC
jgi:hypothetical protein